MFDEKQIAQQLVQACIGGDKAAAAEAHSAMLSKVKAKAERLARTRVNDNA